jgi:predicted nucleotidyltransferase
MTYFEEIFTEMDKRKIRYLVVGGVAVVLHGFIRATADVDLIVALDAKNVEAFLSFMKQRGYRPKPPVPMDDFADPAKRKSWIEEKGMKVFSFFHPHKFEELIDVFVEEPKPFEELYSRRKVIHSGALGVSVIGMSDLMNLKRAAGREQDLQDIKALEDMQKENV